MSIFRDRIAEA